MLNSVISPWCISEDVLSVKPPCNNGIDSLSPQKSATAEMQCLGMPVRTLARNDIPQLMALQAHAVKNLSSSHSSDLVPKTEEQFCRRMSELGILLGVFAEKSNGHPSKLIAYGALALACEKWPVADMVLPREKFSFDPNSLAVIQNNVVHMSYREKGINTELIAARLEICCQEQRPHVMAEVSVKNPASLKGFMKLGFAVISAGVDPDDGCQLLFVHKDVRQPPIHLSKKADLSVNPVSDFEQVEALLKQGYKGMSIQRIGKTSGYVLNLVKPTL